MSELEWYMQCPHGCDSQKLGAQGCDLLCITAGLLPRSQYFCQRTRMLSNVMPLTSNDAPKQCYSAKMYSKFCISLHSNILGAALIQKFPLFRTLMSFCVTRCINNHRLTSVCVLWAGRFSFARTHVTHAESTFVPNGGEDN